MRQQDQNAVRAYFVMFGEREAQESSPFYAGLSLRIVNDPALLELASFVRPGQPIPHLLFAAVRYLIETDTRAATHPFALFYQNPPEAIDGAFAAFQDFCQIYGEDVRQLLETRRVQTNEVRRSAILVPGFATLLQELEEDSSLALIEVGTSAGLNLFWDQYSYEYPAESGGETQYWRKGLSSVPIRCPRKGKMPPPLPPNPEVPITLRVGLDFDPVDIRDPLAVLWLRSLIWPEHQERFALLEAASTEAAQKEPVILLKGDALETLEEALALVPTGALPCIFHSHTLNQFSVEMRKRFDTILRDAAHSTPIYRLALEGLPGNMYPSLVLFRYYRGERTERLLASYEAHGRWIDWQRIQ